MEDETFRVCVKGVWGASLLDGMGGCPNPCFKICVVI